MQRFYSSLKTNLAKAQKPGAGGVERIAEQQDLAEHLAQMGSWSLLLPEDRFVWSEGAFRVFGLEPSEEAPPARTFLQSIAEHDQKRWVNAHRRAVQRGSDIRIEYRYTKAGGEQIWVRTLGKALLDEQSRVVRIDGIVQDVTALREMRYALHASEAKFRDLTLMSSDWVWETGPDEVITYISQSVAAVLGHWASQQVGRRLWEAEIINIPPASWDRLRQAMLEHRPFERFRYSLLSPEGDLKTIAISGRPVISDRGQFLGYRGVGREVSNETRQQFLLELEGNLAAILREHSTIESVHQAILKSLCEQMGWIGGLWMSMKPGTQTVRVEGMLGDAVVHTLSRLPREFAVDKDSPEGLAWQGNTIFMRNIDMHRAFAMRYEAASFQARAAFIAPITDENQRVLSTFIFFSPVAFKADQFLMRVCNILSNNLSLFIQRHLAERNLTHASLHDALTGLPNRVHVTDALRRHLSASQPLALMYIDLDKFKEINDKLGHHAGDEVLIEVSRRFREVIGTRNLAGRMGGDEFIVLLPDAADANEVESIGQRLLSAIEKPFMLQGAPRYLSASIGIAMAPKDGVDAATLISNADAAMYEVKSSGRNGLRFVDTHEESRADSGMLLARDLPSAIQRGEIEMHYQPIVQTSNRALAGVEALIRWRHPTHGLMSADEFLPTADQNALLDSLGKYALGRALDDRQVLAHAADRPFAVSINLPTSLLHDREFVSDLAQMLNERGISPQSVQLEFTQNALMQQSAQTVDQFRLLDGLGVAVHIDHFGRGHASVASLRESGVHGVKIDSSFVRGIDSDLTQQGLVRAMVMMANALNLKVTAVGVTRQEELGVLASLGIQRIQGHFIAEAMTVAQLRHWLASGGPNQGGPNQGGSNQGATSSAAADPRSETGTGPRVDSVDTRAETAAG